MYRKFKIVKVDYKYCNYLRNFDSKVCYNAGSKTLRPFVGVLFSVGEYEYFAPLSSPKEKHKKLKNTLDLIKIKEGNYGVININNMIPVNDKCYEEFDLNKKSNNQKENFRIILMNNQLRWLNSHKNEIYTKSKLLYSLYKQDKLPKNLKDRCCNYPLLEEKCEKYMYKELA